MPFRKKFFFFLRHTNIVHCAYTNSYCKWLVSCIIYAFSNHFNKRARDNHSAAVVISDERVKTGIFSFYFYTNAIYYYTRYLHENDARIRNILRVNFFLFFLTTYNNFHFKPFIFTRNITYVILKFIWKYKVRNILSLQYTRVMRNKNGVERINLRNKKNK